MRETRKAKEKPEKYKTTLCERKKTTNKLNKNKTNTVCVFIMEKGKKNAKIEKKWKEKGTEKKKKTQ